MMEKNLLDKLNRPVSKFLNNQNKDTENSVNYEKVDPSYVQTMTQPNARSSYASLKS